MTIETLLREAKALPAEERRLLMAELAFTLE